MSVKFGIIEHIPDVYRIAEKVEEANRGEVEYCLNVTVDIEEDEEVIHGEMKHLRIVSMRRRIASVPRVMLVLEECLENPKIRNNPKLFKEYVIEIYETRILIWQKAENGKKSAS